MVPRQTPWSGSPESQWAVGQNKMLRKRVRGVDWQRQYGQNKLQHQRIINQIGHTPGEVFWHQELSRSGKHDKSTESSLPFYLKGSLPFNPSVHAPRNQPRKLFLLHFHKGYIKTTSRHQPFSIFWVCLLPLQPWTYLCWICCISCGSGPDGQRPGQRWGTAPQRGPHQQPPRPEASRSTPAIPCSRLWRRVGPSRQTVRPAVCLPQPCQPVFRLGQHLISDGVLDGNKIITLANNSSASVQC